MTQPLVLCYHAVSERWPAPLSVTPAALERHLRLLAARGYRSATFGAVALGERTGAVVAITFDDAYQSVLRVARPLLERHGFVGTVFAPTAFVGGGPMAWDGIDHWLATEHRAELAPMSWEQLAELARAGWEIGSHTRSHPRLTRLDDDQLVAELEGSRADCERALGRTCRTLAYPYGDHDQRVERAAFAAGYLAAASLPSKLHRPRRLAWPRIGIYHVDTPVRFRLKLSPTVRRLRSGLAWRLAELARDRLRPGTG